MIKVRFDGAELASNFTAADNSILDTNEDGTRLYSAVDTKVLSTWTKSINISGCNGVTEGSLIKR